MDIFFSLINRQMRKAILVGTNHVLDYRNTISCIVNKYKPQKVFIEYPESTDKPNSLYKQMRTKWNMRFLIEAYFQEKRNLKNAKKYVRGTNIESEFDLAKIACNKNQIPCINFDLNYYEMPLIIPTVLFTFELFGHEKQLVLFGNHKKYEKFDDVDPTIEYLESIKSEDKSSFTLEREKNMVDVIRKNVTDIDNTIVLINGAAHVGRLADNLEKEGYEITKLYLHTDKLLNEFNEINERV